MAPLIPVSYHTHWYKIRLQTTATVTTTYAYDNLNRLTSLSYSDGTPAESYFFDGAAAVGCTLPTPSPAPTNLAGRMSGMCDASGATAWSYDPMGRTITEARTIGSATDQIGYGYTYNGVVDSVTYPKAGGSSAFTVTYGVNTASQVYSASNGSTTYAQVQSFWADGSPDVYQYGTNIQFQDTFNARLQPLTITASQISPSNTLFSKTYDFHTTRKADNGNLWAVTDGLDALGLSRPNGSANYNYDAMNRVTSAQTLGTDCSAVSGGTRNWGESFTVDPWGNLTAKTVTLCSAETLSASVNTQNQLSAATYDSAGNAIQYNGTSFTFDASGQIVSAGGTSYVYDGEGQRVEKPGKLYWRGAGNDSLAETNSNDTSATYYIFFGGRRIARLDPGQTQPKYYVQDNVGSTSLVTDYLGNILSESEFFPYGGEMQVINGDSNAYKFTGKERDPESGLDDFGARYYTSNLGRFMSPDWDAKPAAVPYASFGDPQTLNLYSYVENGPLNRVDADGHMANPNVRNNWVGNIVTPDADILAVGELPALGMANANPNDNPERGLEAAEEAAYNAGVAEASQAAEQQSAASAQQQDATARREQAAEAHAKNNMDKYGRADKGLTIRPVAGSCGGGNHNCQYELVGNGSEKLYVYEHQTSSVLGGASQGTADYVTPGNGGEANTGIFYDVIGGTNLDTYRFFTVSGSATYNPSDQHYVPITELGGVHGFEHMYSTGGDVYINGSTNLSPSN